MKVDEVIKKADEYISFLDGKIERLKAQERKDELLKRYNGEDKVVSWKELEEVVKNGKPIEKFKSGMEQFDNSLRGGIELGRLISFSASSKSGKTANTWVKYAEWEFYSQWQDEIEKALWYGKSNINANGTTSMKGASGNAIYSSAGVEAQIAPANKRYYTQLTESVIREFMDDLSYNGTEDGPREYIAFCGRGFMNLFDIAMKDSASRFTLVDSKFISGSGQELTLSGQFKTYVGLNGDKMTLKELPLYNNVVRNRQLNPQTGKPAESYKATFLNFKMDSSGESNVMKVYTKDREMASWYIEGACGPYGMKKNAASSSPVDGYEMHVLSECGVMLKNPTDAAQLVLDVDAL